MKRLISVLRENNIECVPNERFTLDVEMFPANVEEHPFPKQVLFECPKLEGGKKSVPEAAVSMFRRFLDVKPMFFCRGKYTALLSSHRQVNP